jgi:hypothetical protein
VIVCLGACLAASPAAEHACCDGQDGFRGSTRDCCVLTQGEAPAPTHVAPAASVVLSLPDEIALFMPPVVANAVPVAPAASPPLVLRV